jgi:hypothetical protein
MMPERPTHDHVRQGAVSSRLDAFNIADRTVISSIPRRHRAIEFKKFLPRSTPRSPTDLDVHLVCDNDEPQNPDDQRPASRHPVRKLRS